MNHVATGHYSRLENAASHIGRAYLLASSLLKALARPGSWIGGALEETRRQLFASLPLVLFLTALGAAVTAQQTAFQFQSNLPSWVIGSIVAASVISELAPLLTGIALVGIVGARIAAELGSMQVSQQVDALEVVGRDPVSYLVMPRVVAGTVTGPVLVSLALGISLVAGWLVSVAVSNVTTAEFWFGVRSYVWDFPFIFALIKGAVFGLWITFLACYVGLEADSRRGGVGTATTHAVVAMITAVLLLDTALAPMLGVFG